MNATATLAACVTRAYSAQTDPSFADVLRDAGVDDDDALADLIELDARMRLESNLAVDVQRYLRAAPDLPKRRIALDAAIEFAIRGGEQAGLTAEQAASRIVLERPDLAHAVSLAVTLNQQVCSTTSLNRALDADERIALPRDFGPRLEDGRARYELRQLLGAGAQGQVYSAVDRAMSEPDRPAFVAIKVLRIISDDPRWRDLFVEEGLKARRIAHANVVRVLDRGTDGDLGDYVVYEQVDGGSLASLMLAHPNGMEPRRAADLMARICRGMHAVHLGGLLHCDLKPTNVLLTREGEPKVADFGAAARLQEHGGAPTPERIGNKAFMAPEQSRSGERVLAVTSDVYALGGLLYYLLTGVIPSGSAAASPLTERAAIDADLDAICRRATATDPAARYGSADAMADDLESWLAFRPLEWARSSTLRRFRLFLRRQPGTAAVGILGLAAALATSGVVVYIAMSARQSALQVRLENAAQLAAQQEATNFAISSSIAAFQEIIAPDKRHAITSEWLLPGTITESVAGPFLFNPRVPTREMWADRLAAAREIIAHAEKEGHKDSLEALWWHDAIAFWSLRAGDFKTASESLEANEAGWSRTLSPEDPWISLRENMKMCALVQRLEAQAAQGVPPDRAELQRCAERLKELLNRLAQRVDGDGMRLLNLSHQAKLFSTPLLNDPVRLAEVRAKLVEAGVPLQSNQLRPDSPVP